MATSRTTRAKRATPHSRPAQNANRRTARAKRLSSGTKAPRPGQAEQLSSWKALANENERTPVRPRASAALIEKVSTRRFVLLLLAVAAVFTLYVGHVHATQDLAAELQQVRKENLKLHLKLNRLKGDFDRATGPAVIYQRARALGLEESFEYGPTIHEAESR